MCDMLACQSIFLLDDKTVMSMQHDSVECE